MPRWKPEQIWKDRDVFIIGGGESLQHFDWNLLKPELTIGCNDAFLLGEQICKICIFGDSKWFKAFKDRLLHFRNAVFTNCVQLQDTKIDWLWVIQRASRGLHHNALGWNGNTGASAINLALLLGARRIFLLGFDMHLSKEGKPNWHKNELDKSNKNIYPTFLKDFGRVAKDLPKKFPGREIINVTDDSSLNKFRKIGVKKFWTERSKKKCVES